MLVERFLKDMAGRQITKQEGNFSLFSFGGSLRPFTLTSFLARYYDLNFGPILLACRRGLGAVFFDFELYKSTTFLTFEHFRRAGSKEATPEYRDFDELIAVVGGHYRRNHPRTLSGLTEDELGERMGLTQDLMDRVFVSTIFSESLDEDMVRGLFDRLAARPEDFTEFFAVGAAACFPSFVLRQDQLLMGRDWADDYGLQYLFSDYSVTLELSSVGNLIETTLNDRGGSAQIVSEAERVSAEISQNAARLATYRAGLSAEAATLLDFMQLTMYVRDRRKDLIQQIMTMSSNLAREAFRRAGLPADLIAFALPGEIANSSWRQSAYAESLAARSGGVTYYVNAGVELIEAGPIDQGIKALYDAMAVGQVSEIKGNVACRGLVRGLVAVVLGGGDFAKFKSGDILVASMTRPEYVPLMKRAAVVVTDEGGITCHAAIISRELKIPCLIGTKIATQVLHDGDLVEVDAEKGIVKIIEKAN